MEYVCTFEGARFVCSKLHNAADFATLFGSLLPLLPRLMVNSVGHSVCRALYREAHCSFAQKQQFLRALLPSFVSIATNQTGSFALISLFSLLRSAAEIEIAAQGFARRADFDTLILCQSGYHVLKKFLDFGAPHFGAVLDGLAGDFAKYASHHYGVPIIRGILDKLAADARLLARHRTSLQSLALYADVLVANQFGNYVIQQLLDIAPPTVTDLIKGRMQKKFAFFAKHKFASNVVEKIVVHATATAHPTPTRDWLRIVVHELLSDAARLINHKFGNYCLQTALSACIAAQRGGLLRDFVEAVRPLLHLLRVNVRKKWQQLLFDAESCIAQNHTVFD